MGADTQQGRRGLGLLTPRPQGPLPRHSALPICVPRACWVLGTALSTPELTCLTHYHPDEVGTVVSFLLQEGKGGVGRASTSQGHKAGVWLESSVTSHLQGDGGSVLTAAVLRWREERGQGTGTSHPHEVVSRCHPHLARWSMLA